MSGFTTTPRFALKKPTEGADNDVWGGHLNGNADIIDTNIPSPSSTAPAMDGSAAVGTGTTFARADHVHPTDTSRAPLASPVFTGAPSFPTGAIAITAAPGDNDTSIATTAFVTAAVTAGTVSPSAANPAMDSTAAPGVSTLYSRGDHVHPTDTSRYAATNPNGYQTAAQVTTSLGAYLPLAGGTMSGTLIVGNGSGDAYVSFNAASGAHYSAFAAAVLGTNRWNINFSGVPTETGSGNIGSDLNFYRYSDGGSQIDSPLSISRTSGVALFSQTPTAPTAAVADNSTKLATTAFVSAAVATSLHNVGRNYCHNSMFNIAQRGAGPFSTFGSYTLDRWILNGTLDTGTVTQIALTDTDRAQIGDEEARFAYQVVFVGNAGATANSRVQQYIENARRLGNKTVTISFYAKATVAGVKLGVSTDQSFGTGGSPSASTTQNGQAVTLTTSWVRYSTTSTLPSITGVTFGTANDDRTQLNIWTSAGANSATRAGNIGVQSGTVQLWGVQLELGPTATPLEKLDPVTQLQQCQRFYQTGILAANTYGPGSNIAVGFNLSFPVQMRGQAQVAISGTPFYQNCSALTFPYTDSRGYTYQVLSTAAGGYSISSSITASADL